MANSVTGNVDGYGFERPEDYDFKSYDDFMSHYLMVLTRRAQQWSHSFLPSNPMKRSRKLKRYIRKGIPSEYRPVVWMYVSGAEERQQQNPDLYKKLLQGPHKQDLLDTIKIDMHRTFPDNIYFHDVTGDPNCKRNALFNVLIATAHNNESVGYCQGMNFIAGMLLIVVKDEEKVFWLMDVLLNKILQDYYSPGMVGVSVDCEVLGQLIRLKAPEVYALCETCGCAWSIVATKWFICLFADVMPVETVYRLWDCLFYEGDKVLFRVGVTLVKMQTERLLKCRSFTDLMEVFRSMTSDLTTLNCPEFIKSIFEQPGSFSRSLLKKLREECRQKVIANG